LRVGEGSQVAVFGRATIRQRVQLLAVVLAIGLMIVGVLGPLAVRERDAAARDQRERIEPLRSGIGDLLLAAIDERSAVRGYLLAGDASSLEQYEVAKRTVRATLLRLEVLAADDPRFVHEIAEVRDSLERWEEEVAEPMIALVGSGAAQEALAFERTGAGQDLFESVRAEIMDLRQQLIAETRAADDRAAAARGRLAGLLWGLAFAGVGFVLVTGVSLRNWVTSPLERIGEAVEAVTRGDRHRTIPAVGPPDLARLAANVEAMRAETVRRLDEAVRAKQALEQQGPAVVTLRAELAPTHPRLPGTIELASAFEPAEGELAGDWYDLVDLQDGRVTLMMVDVSGHGPSAGVFALRAKHLLLAVMRDGLAPGETLGWLADRIGETGELFLTCVVIEIDTRTRRVRYANAGHPPPIVVDRSGDRPRVDRFLGPTGPLLGPFPGHWDTAQVTLPPGAHMVVYTDGLVEARDASGELFGEKGLTGVLDGLRTTPREMAATCVQRVRAFSDDHVDDDMTVLVVHLPVGADGA
jgi:serine phosphatase RsbU (regulator of sigma subunit)/CHASE3 domain sensor protein